MLLSAANILGRGSFVLAFIILARGLAAADLASANFFVLTMQMIVAYATLGVGVAATRYFPLIDTNSLQVRLTIHALTALSLGAAALVLVGIPVVWPRLTSGALDWLFVAAVAFVILDLIPAGALIGMQMYRQTFAVAAISSSILIAGAMLAAQMSSVRVAYAAIVCSYGAKVLLDVVLAARRLGPHFWRPFTPALSEMRSVMRLLGPLAITSVMAGTGPWVLGEMVRARWSDTDYSFYSIGLQWYAMGFFIPTILTTVSFPMQVRAAQGDGPSAIAESRRLLIHSIALVLAAAVVVIAVSVPLSWWIVALYGPRFLAEPWIVWAFIGAAGLGAPAAALGAHLVSIDRQYLWTSCTAAWLVILLIAGNTLTQYDVAYSPAALAIANVALCMIALAVVWRTSFRRKQQALAHE